MPILFFAARPKNRIIPKNGMALRYKTHTLTQALVTTIFYVI